ncbi:MAG TPA: AI-2E family transporter [Candidatus Binataceae bacterium]|jgi:predicted PurR-regulated permease PerM
MERERIIQVFFFGFLALMAYALYQLFSPFLVAIVWAILLAFIFHPLMVHTERLVKSHTLAATLVTVTVALVIILPSIWLGSLLAGEAESLYATASDLIKTNGLARLQQQLMSFHLVSDLNNILGQHGVRIEEEVPKIGVESLKYTSNALLENVSGAAKNLAEFFIDLGIVLLTLFYLLRDGEQYYEMIRNLTPLHEDDKEAVFDTLRITLSSVLRGLLLTALAQGFVMGAAYLILGVPYAAFLSILTAASGLLPFAGTGLVWVPVSAYLLYFKGWASAIAMLVWGALSVGIIDNIVKPYAMGHGTGLPSVVLLFGIAGGLTVYGPLGLFLGPAIIAVFAALLRAYSRTYMVRRREAA